MKRKWEYLGLSLAIIALALYIGLRKTDRVRYRLPEIESIGGIDRMTIERNGSPLTLVNRGGTWVILPDGYPADPSVSAGMAQAAADLRISDLVSTSGDLARYGLDDTQRIKVAAYDGEEKLRGFFVGKSTGRTTFISLENDSRVFATPAGLRSLFERDREALRDKRVLSFPPESINEIAIAAEAANEESGGLGGAGRRLIRAVVPDDEEGEIILWETAGGEELDAERVEETVRRLSELRCVRFLEPGDARGIPDLVIELKGAVVHRLVIYPEREDGYPAESSAVQDPFLVSKWIVEELVEALSGAEADSAIDGTVQ